jgi:hypothetical protein
MWQRHLNSAAKPFGTTGATQHYAVNDYGDVHRVVQRVTVSGVRPMGLDGWQSEPRRGDGSAYQAGFGARRDEVGKH